MGRVKCVSIVGQRVGVLDFNSFLFSSMAKKREQSQGAVSPESTGGGLSPEAIKMLKTAREDPNSREAKKLNKCRAAQFAKMNRLFTAIEETEIMDPEICNARIE